MTPDHLFSLAGKTALVTGGATGIGRMAAEGLMGAGAHVLIASRKGEACEEAATWLNALDLPGRAEGFAGDVGSEAGVAALAEAVAERTDRLHILMNNAGRTWGAPLPRIFQTRSSSATSTSTGPSGPLPPAARSRAWSMRWAMARGSKSASTCSPCRSSADSQATW